MKNVSTLKPNSKIDSPKTPGGISKSLLTPCRRVGLSRNWRKSGPSPFVSPLASEAEVKLEKQDVVSTKRETRKRKERCDEVESAAQSCLTPVSKGITESVENNGDITVVADKNDIDTTPSRIVSNPRRKKSKTVLSSHTVSNDNIIESPKTSAHVKDVEIVEKIHSLNRENNVEQSFDNIKVETPVRTKSKSKVIDILDIESAQDFETKENLERNENEFDSKKEETPVQRTNENVKHTSPDKLTKECIVVIQKKIYKKDLEKLKQKPVKDAIELHKTIVNPVSQALFDSDSDDVPLSTLNKKEIKPMSKLEILDEDDDFAESTKMKVKKFVDRTTSIGGLSESSKKKSKLKKDILPQKTKIVNVPKLESKPSSQSSLDDDDEDFIMDNRRTIIIRKTYEKVAKPTKAKSTGSITQKDIDDLKAKIEMKKKLLMAKAVTEDTQELRDLVKKWQRGCQDALMELMELMKNKFPDKQNMDYSEILQTLKIPATLVGYDEENDCFNTPTDETIILSKFNDT